MAQDWKVERVKELKEEINKYSTYIFTDYRGLNVDQITKLRKSLREIGAEYHVIKNRYTKIAVLMAAKNQHQMFCRIASNR